MSEQENNQTNDEEFRAGSENRAPLPGWIVPGLITLLTLALALATIWRATRPTQHLPAQEVGTLLPGLTSTTQATATQKSSVTAKPTDTLTSEPMLLSPPMLAQADDAQNSEESKAAEAILVLLPTVTPTPLADELLRRRVEVSSKVTLTLLMQNALFENPGEPLYILFEDRAYSLNADQVELSDHWCKQVGLVHLRFALNLRLDLSTAAVNASGAVSLINDFCDNPGALSDAESFDLNVRAGESTLVTPNLQIQGMLFLIPGLLDTETQTAVEIIISNQLLEAP